MWPYGAMGGGTDGTHATHHHNNNSVHVASMTWK